MNKGRALIMRCALALAAVAVLAGVSAMKATAQDKPGAVYVLTNDQKANSVMVYARAADGTLTFSGSFLTGGKGAGTGGDPLGSQNSLVLGRWHQLLFAVNAGSNSVSVFAVNGQGLHPQLLDVEPSGGTMPVSVAAYGNLVYVLNAGGAAPNIQGFLLDPIGGKLIHLAHSKRNLPGGMMSGAAQVGFSPDGEVLIVTEKNTNDIDTWTVSDDGDARDGATTKSNGAIPFGFTFAQGNFAIVTEAGPSSLSSYDADDNGELDLITGSLPDGGKANCWVVVTKDGHFAFNSNTASGTISTYSVAEDSGSLSLLNSTGANTGKGTAPIDMALSDDSHFLYARDAASGTVDGFRVESDGSLTSVGSASGVPMGAQGVAAQ